MQITNSIHIEKDDSGCYICFNGDRYFKSNLQGDFMVCKEYKSGEAIELVTKMLDMLDSNRYLVVNYGGDAYAITINKIELTNEKTTKLDINKFRKINITKKTIDNTLNKE